MKRAIAICNLSKNDTIWPLDFQTRKTFFYSKMYICYLVYDTCKQESKLTKVFITHHLFEWGLGKVSPTAMESSKGCQRQQEELL